MQDKPGPYINEIKDTVMYYGNRVLKEFKDKCALVLLCGSKRSSRIQRS